MNIADIEVGVKYKHADWPDCVYLGIKEENFNRKFLLVIESNDTSILWTTVGHDSYYEEEVLECDVAFWNKFSKLNE